MRGTHRVSTAAREGLERHQAGDMAGAHRAYQNALRADPDDFHAHLWLGALLHQAGRSEQAEAFMERATVLGPAVPDAWVNLGVIRNGLDRHEQARADFLKALELEPQLEAAWLGLGNALQGLGRHSKAREAYDRAVALAPDDPVAHFNRATLLARLGRHGEAIDAARASLAIDADQVAAHGLVADSLLNLGRHEAALESAAAGLALEPDNADLLYSRGFGQAELGRLVDARRSFDAALAARPEHGGALAASLFTRRQLCQWEGTERLLQRFRAGIEGEVEGLTPFSFLAENGTRSEQRACARLWSRQWPTSADPGPDRLHARETDRLTIGYLSADFYRHPTAYLAVGLFEHHDRDRFRVIGYSNSRDDGSEIRRRCERAFDDFVDLRTLSTREAADRIRADRVDILVDLKGHTLEAATGVLALRPAPIQAQYLGYPGTMGAPYVDYLLGDAVVTPAAHQADYDEALVQLPGSYQVNDGKRPRPGPAGTREDHGLPEGRTVFCCFNNPWKINPGVFDAWCEVLGALPGSVLWLLGRQSAPEVAVNLRREAAVRKVDPDRLVFSKSRPLEDYLALYHHADLFLDTWPYNAHTTASDALWMGCPVLTLLGDTFAGRVGASLLSASGLGQLICDDVESFRQNAIDLGRDRARLANLRKGLERGRESFPLFDTAAWTRHIEAAFLEMARRQRSGDPGPFAL